MALSKDFTIPSFIEKLDTTFICQSCNNWLYPPVKQTLCGHRFHEVCILKILNSPNKMCPANREDCVELSSHSVFPDRFMDKELYGFQVRCTYYPECNTIVLLKDWDRHIGKCDFVAFPCPNMVLGCPEAVSNHSLEKHLRDKCRFKSENCPYCNEKIRTELMKEHEQVCQNDVINCEYKEVGCTRNGSRVMIRDHMTIDLSKHMNLMRIALKREERLTKELNAKIQALTERETASENLIGIVQNEHSLLEKQFHESKSETERHILEQDCKIEQMFENLDSSQINAKQISKLDQRISVLETREAQLNVRQEYQEEKAKLVSQGKTIAMHDVTIAEYEIRFRCLETANYDGVLVWKIQNYAARKQAAVFGRTMSIYSQPFYTHAYGYKLCARMYLNGDGLGKGTHASLYFVVMKGDNDALLPWPFRQKVTLILMDQGGNSRNSDDESRRRPVQNLRNSRRHIQDTFRPDPTSSSFQRPINAMNIASGSPLFVSQEELESRFVSEDTIFIMVKVDTSDLNHFGI